MKKEYILTVQIPVGDERLAEKVYRDLQAVAVDVMMENGVNAEGLQMRDVSLKEDGRRDGE